MTDFLFVPIVYIFTNNYIQGLHLFILKNRI